MPVAVDRVDAWDVYDINYKLVGFDHIDRNPPVLIRTPKLTRSEPAQYWGGGPPGNSVVLNPILFFFRALQQEVRLGGGDVHYSSRLWKTILDSTGSKPTAGNKTKR